MQSIHTQHEPLTAGAQAAASPIYAGKTIWIVNQYAGSKHHGMVFRHYYLGREFVKRGCHVYVMAASYTHLHTKHPEVSGMFTMEDIDGIHYCWVKVPAYEKSTTIRRALNMLAFAYRLRRLNVSDFTAPDVIILSSPSPFPVLTVRTWCRRFKARFVFEIRDIWPQSLVEIAGVSRYHPFVVLTGWFERMAYKYAEKVVSVIPEIRAYTARFKVPDHRVHYIPNGVCADDVAAALQDGSRPEDSIPRREFVVGYAGALSVANSLHHLIEAASLLRHRDDIAFVILGDGGLKEDLKRMAAHLPNVTFMDAIPKDQVPGVIERFDLCYAGRGGQPVYLYGVSPNKVFDYMLAGKPVVHSTSTPHDPVSFSGCGWLVPPENARAIADAIEKFSAMSAEKRGEVGERGRKFVLQHHTYSRLADAYLALCFEEC